MMCQTQRGFPNLGPTHTPRNGSEQMSAATALDDTIVRAVIPSQFMSVPPCNLTAGLSGYFLVRSVGCYHASFSGEEVFTDWLIPVDEDTPDFVPRDVKAQFLRPWTSEQMRVFAPVPDVQHELGEKAERKQRRSLSEKLKDIDEFLT